MYCRILILITAVLLICELSAVLCLENRSCRLGVLIEDYKCACPPLFFGDCCQFDNKNYYSRFPCTQNETLDCQNGGICVVIRAKPYCMCSNTEFTGEFCQFNRSCNATCSVPLTEKNGTLACPNGKTKMHKSCPGNFSTTQSQSSNQTQTLTSIISTQTPIINYPSQNSSQTRPKTSPKTSPQTSISPTNTTEEPDSSYLFEMTTIIIIVNAILALIICIASVSLVTMVFCISKSYRRRRKSRKHPPLPKTLEEGANTSKYGGTLRPHYEVPYSYLPDTSTALKSQTLRPTYRIPISNENYEFPNSFRVNNCTFSIHSNISDLYFEIEEFHNNNNERLSPSYAVIVPSADDRESVCSANIHTTANRKIPPPIPPKPKLYLGKYWEPGSDYPTLFDQMNRSRYKELKPENLKLFNRLGGGHFGEVWRGTLDTPIGEIPVAIKLMKQTSDSQEEIAFLQEAAIIGQFNHVNVLKLIGVTTLSDPKLIITELMAVELRDYLLRLKQRPAPPALHEIGPVFVGFGRDIASGMAYLSQKGFIHRDLAARNILLDAQNVCKIADFGMSRRLMDSDYYKMKENAIIPLKWSAPESIFYKKYHAKSDVWSYAMVLFEVWSLGVKPWPFDKLDAVISKLNESVLLPPPPGCPRDVYLIMVLCWHPQSDERPAFSDLVRMFDELARERLDPPPGSARDTLLGGDLRYSEDMYRDLQFSYRK